MPVFVTTCEQQCLSWNISINVARP